MVNVPIKEITQPKTPITMRILKFYDTSTEFLYYVCDNKHEPLINKVYKKVDIK